MYLLILILTFFSVSPLPIRQAHRSGNSNDSSTSSRRNSICFTGTVYILGQYSCNNITTTLIQISRLFYFGFFSKTNHQMIIKLTPIVFRSKNKWYKAQKVQKYALNSQALQILTNDDEVENWSLSSFLLAVNYIIFFQTGRSFVKTHQGG